MQGGRPVPVKPETLGSAPRYFPINTPRAQINPGIQSQLDLLTIQIASLTSAMSHFAPGPEEEAETLIQPHPKVQAVTQSMRQKKD